MLALYRNPQEVASIELALLRIMRKQYPDRKQVMAIYSQLIVEVLLYC